MTDLEKIAEYARLAAKFAQMSKGSSQAVSDSAFQIIILLTDEIIKLTVPARAEGSEQ